MTYIIAEAGSNWRVSKSQEINRIEALKLVTAAAKAGSDAVKFQLFKGEKVYAKGAGKFRGWEVEEGFKTLELPSEWLPDLKYTCDLAGIDFLCSAFDEGSYEAVDPFVKMHKVASGEVDHLPLLTRVGSFGKPVLLSTGGATWDEVRLAESVLIQGGASDVVILQCTMAYPAPPEGMGLGVLRELAFNGLSDHSEGLVAPIVATALGAKVIEKHFTLDKSNLGPDHAYALNFGELRDMVLAVRETEKMMGAGIKVVHPCEEELRAFAKRRAMATTNVAPGDHLIRGKNYDYLRPGNRTAGLKASDSIPVTALRSYEEGEGL